MNEKSSSLKAALAFLGIMVFLLGSCAGKEVSGSSSFPDRASGAVSVDILFLNHFPVLSVLANVDRLLAEYGDKLSVTRYDFDTPAGAAFAKKKGLAGHIPLVLFINGSQTFKLGDHAVTFQSFPKGGGPGMVADGEWAMADLGTALKVATGK